MIRASQYLQRVILSAMLLLPWGTLASSDIVVIVAADSPVQQLSKGQLINIFLGRSSYFDNGLRAIPLDQHADSDTREQFYSSLLDWSPAKLKAHWSKVIFTGRGKPPRQLDSDADVKTMVSNSRNAIGYIQRGSVDDHVKIITISP